MRILIRHKRFIGFVFLSLLMITNIVVTLSSSIVQHRDNVVLTTMLTQVDSSFTQVSLNLQHEMRSRGYVVKKIAMKNNESSFNYK